MLFRIVFLFIFFYPSQNPSPKLNQVRKKKYLYLKNIPLAIGKKYIKVKTRYLSLRYMLFAKLIGASMLKIRNPGMPTASL